MNARNNSFAIALAEAQRQAAGNKGPTIAEQRAGFTADPLFADLFRAARANAQAALDMAQARLDFVGDADSLHALQRAQAAVESVERQINVARELHALARDVNDDVLRNARRVDSWTAAIGTRADKLARKAVE